MAIATEQIKQFMASIGGRPEDNLKMLLYYGDANGNFTDDEDWDALCEFALAVDAELGMSEPFASRYGDLIDRGEFQEVLDAMEYDLKDNKIFAAMAIHNLGIPKNRPMIAAAAFNKHSYQGLKDEFALVRFLHWSGFDINAAKAPNGMTPLHLFASTKVMPGTHPRAVAWLLDHGADVDAVNVNGDTAMAYLCGTQGWGEAQSLSFDALVKAGSNPFAQSSDGTTPVTLLMQANEAEFSQERADTIEVLVGAFKEAVDGKEAQVDQDEDGPAESHGQSAASVEEHADAAPVQPEVASVQAADSDDASAVNVVDGIPPELMAAARAYRMKGGSLGAFGRWAFNSKTSTPESEVSEREFEIKWAKRHLGKPSGDKIIADARRASGAKDAV